MIDDILKSIRTNLVDRITSPLTGSFVVSWLVINWKIVLVLFSISLTAPEKIEYIEVNCIGIWTNLIFPIIFAVIFANGYPWLERISFKLWTKVRKERDVLSQDLQRSLKLTYKETIDFYKEMEEKERGIHGTVTKKDGEIMRLNKEISENRQKAIQDTNEAVSAAVEKNRAKNNADNRVMIDKTMELTRDIERAKAERATIEKELESFLKTELEKDENKLRNKPYIDQIKETRVLGKLFNIELYGNHYLIDEARGHEEIKIFNIWWKSSIEVRIHDLKDDDDFKRISSLLASINIFALYTRQFANANPELITPKFEDEYNNRIYGGIEKYLTSEEQSKISLWEIIGSISTSRLT